MTDLIQTERDYFAAEFGPQKHAITGETLPGHVMTVLHDEAPYRHIRFARPYTGIWSFNLVTWPGHLAITGDLDDYVFARSFDMAEFFRADGYHPGINPDYWAEKVVAASVHGPIRQFSIERYKQHIRERAADEIAARRLSTEQDAALWAAVDADLFDEEYDGEIDDHEAHKRLDRFGFRYMDGPKLERLITFQDHYEWDFKDFSHGYLRSCWAIRFGIDMYLAQPGVKTFREIAT